MKKNDAKTKNAESMIYFMNPTYKVDLQVKKPNPSYKKAYYDLPTVNDIPFDENTSAWD